jgi:hypothetical protein
MPHEITPSEKPNDAQRKKKATRNNDKRNNENKTGRSKRKRFFKSYYCVLLLATFCYFAQNKRVSLFRVAVLFSLLLLFAWRFFVIASFCVCFAAISNNYIFLC